jgi:hypothetical protein
MGFADPDKKNPLHDLACVYIAQKGFEIANHLVPPIPREVKVTFMKMIEDKSDLAKLCHKVGSAPSLVHEVADFTVEADVVNSVMCVEIYFEMEKIITHRSGNYRRDVGFLDVCVFVKRSIDFNLPKICEKLGRDDLKKIELVRESVLSMAFEVKTTPGSTYNAIRQIKLYKEYVDTRIDCNGRPIPVYDYWVLATTFPISEAEKFALKNEGILWLQLGPKFAKWASEQI